MRAGDGRFRGHRTAAMSNATRFGRKIPMPSTVEIKHDLRLMEAADAIVAGTAEQRDAIVGDLATKHGLPHDRAMMLAARLGIGRESLEGAAHDRRAGKA